MNIYQSSWQDGHGISIHLQAWEPEGKPKAAVALLHGLGEHIVRYAPVAQALAKAGFAVMGIDLRGHGRSGGRRGHTPSYETLLDDVDGLLEHMRSRYPRARIFLYGHSLGGTLVINYALRRPPKLQGVIATAPWLRTVVQAPALKVALARVLEPILPTYTEKWRKGPTDLSQDATVMSEAQDDPLLHDFISARMYRGATDAGVYALEHAADFPLPLLLMHGTDDKITSWEASQEFAQRLGKKCTWRRWDGWYHELHNEPGRGQIVRTIVNWMNHRLQNGRAAGAPAGQMRRAMRKSRPIRKKGV